MAARLCREHQNRQAEVADPGLAPDLPYLRSCHSEGRLLARRISLWAFPAKGNTASEILRSRPGRDLRMTNAALLRGTGFSPWGFVLARRKPHRLKSVLRRCFCRALTPDSCFTHHSSLVTWVTLRRRHRHFAKILGRRKHARACQLASHEPANFFCPVRPGQLADPQVAARGSIVRPAQVVHAEHR